METGHLKTRYERAEVYKRTLATCQSNLTKYFLSTFSSHLGHTQDSLDRTAGRHWGQFTYLPHM